jgi:cobalt-zinc-cadmium efflux system membrane fusion protein
MTLTDQGVVAGLVPARRGHRCRGYIRKPRASAQQALLLVLLTIACGDTEHAAPKVDDHGHEEHDHATVAERAPNTVRIRPDMLRDLHITTAPAEVRASGEGVTALGEVRVNEAAYAEIGVAIAARVVRVSAAAGDAVVAGQPLAVLQSVEVGRARATLLAGEADAKLARSTLERKRELARERVVPARELQEAEAAAAAAASSLEAARAALAALGVSLERDVAERRTRDGPGAPAVLDR